MAAPDAQPQGFYSTTSGTYFSDKDSLAEHYKSDFHKYNLKRKVAGLPPVTKEWFDARREQLSITATVGPVQKFWYDPLTKKKFNSENTYVAHVNSKKYKDLVRKTGQEAPAPVVTMRRADAAGAASATAAKPAVKPAYNMAIPNGVQPQKAETPASPTDAAMADDSASEADSAGWETASDNETDSVSAQAPSSRRTSAGEAARLKQSTSASSSGPHAMDTSTTARVDDASASGTTPEATSSTQDFEEWDVCRSLFDNHVSASLEANLEYMYKHFGFYLPDADYLSDPAGLIKYLGLKLQYGHVPLYVHGDDSKSKQFTSLHGVQRHMVDANKCKMAFDDNEEEYLEFYDWSKLEDELTDKQLAVSETGESAASLGYELEVAGDAEAGSSSKVLGSREFARYYKQHHKPADTRTSVVINTVVAKYRALGVGTSQPEDAEVKRVQKLQKRFDRLHLNTAMRSNVIRNLPNNVPY
ncbi:hypothetical protein ABBQ38_004953 [Trebouxia sp. C0009 RCD-2024]